MRRSLCLSSLKTGGVAHLLLNVAFTTSLFLAVEVKRGVSNPLVELSWVHLNKL